MSNAQTIAAAVLAGFNKHYTLFRAKSSAAKALFDAGDWHGIQQLGTDRIQMYDERVDETVSLLRQTAAVQDHAWAEAKREYIALLINHPQPELAETFFNSVSTKLLDKRYYNNEHLFLKPATSTEYIDGDAPTFVSFYPKAEGLAGCLKHLLCHFGWRTPFACLKRDIANILQAARAHLRSCQEW